MQLSLFNSYGAAAIASSRAQTIVASCQERLLDQLFFAGSFALYLLPYVFPDTTFLVTRIKHAGKGSSQAEGLILVHSSRAEPALEGTPSGRSLRQLATLHSVRKGRDGCWCSDLFLLFIKSRLLAHGMVPLHSG